MKSLDLFNNEVTNMDNYREKVFNLIPSLRFLDGYEIMIHFFIVCFLKSTKLSFCFRFDVDDHEVDESEDDEVNGNEDGDGDANEEESEEG